MSRVTSLVQDETAVCVLGYLRPSGAPAWGWVGRTALHATCAGTVSANGIPATFATYTSHCIDPATQASSTVSNLAVYCKCWGQSVMPSLHATLANCATSLAYRALGSADQHVARVQLTRRLALDDVNYWLRHSRNHKVPGTARCQEPGCPAGRPSSQRCRTSRAK